MNISTNPWVWFGAIGTISILSSVLYRDNAFYRAFEHIFVGASSGYFVAVNFRNLVDQGYRPIVEAGRISLIIPMILGLMLYARYFKPVAYLSRWGTAFLVGVGAGLSIFGLMRAQFIAQIRANMLPLTSINNIIMVVGVLAVLTYFYFTVFTKSKTVHSASLVGRYVMMLTFGIAFGNVVMGRISLLLGVLGRLLSGWLGIY